MIKVLRANKSFLFGLFALAFLVRAAVFIGYLSKNQNYWQVDSTTYHVVAKQIADSKGISTPDGKPCFYRLPGYPLFLAFYYKMFGADSQNVLWMQIFFAAFIPILIFLLSLSLFPMNLTLAKAAGIYGSVHIGLTLYAGFFMTETIFICLFLIFLFLFVASVHLFFCPIPTSFSSMGDKEGEIPFYFFALPEPIATSEPYLLLFEDMFSSEVQEMAGHYYKNQIQSTSPILFLAGLVLGLASLVRPVGHYILILTFLLILFSNCKFLIKVQKMFFTFFGWLIPVSFWIARNYILTGSLFFHTLPGGHFLYLSAARVAMFTHDCSYQQARDILKNEIESLIKQEEQSQNRKLNEIERCRLHEKLAIKYFKMKPCVTLKNWLTDIFRTSFSLYSAEILFIESGRKSEDYFNKNRSLGSMLKKYIWPSPNKPWLNVLVWLEMIAYLFILIGLFLGAINTLVSCIKGWTGKNAQILCPWIMSMLFIFLFIFIALSGGYARMRLPIEPMLIILSLNFWISLFRRQSTLET